MRVDASKKSLENEKIRKKREKRKHPSTTVREEKSHRVALLFDLLFFIKSIGFRTRENEICLFRTVNMVKKSDLLKNHEKKRQP